MRWSELKPKISKPVLAPILVTLAAMAVIIVWLSLTPKGLDGKLLALADSVCRGNPDHRLQIGGKLLPLCARCTGMFLGCALGVIGFGRITKNSGYPSPIFRVVIGLLVLFFAVDGVNSGIDTLFDHALYTPTNELRLITGLSMGLALGAIIVPLWRQIMLGDIPAGPGLRRWNEFLPIFLAEAAMVPLILYAPEWMYLPVAVISTLTIPILVTIVYTLLWILILKKEAVIRNRSQKITYIALGCLTAFIQIGLFDLLRVVLLGTWAGIQF
jgi:uncharacterized membrane protein